MSNNQTTTTTTSFKTNKKPSQQVFNVNPSNNSSGQGKMTTDQLILQISQVNGAVKAGDFSPQLASQIFSLCQHLKSNGHQLEQTNKAEMNKIFVSLRQACCRDNGQLGTPCRLKIMELIELRAMGWKTNLAHTQYYLNKMDKVNGQQDNQVVFNQPVSSSSKIHPVSSTQRSSISSGMNSFQSNQINQPVYQPSPMQVPMISQQQFGNFGQPPPSIYLPAEIAANSQSMAQGAPGYFLIPAAGAWTSQMIPTNMLAGYGPPPIRQPPPHGPPPPAWMARNAAIAAVSAHFGKVPPPSMMSQSAYVPGSSSSINIKSGKLPQLREEVTIRNCDSGKIMGVKGRRVATVEELSKTVISFQKVDNNSRYRTLAITGSTPESIQYAKRLIDETIKRNVSPNRLDLNGSTDHSRQSNEPTSVIGVEGSTKEPIEEEEEDEYDPEISIETGQDGTLKVSCADPEMLQAAQQALTEYLTLRTNRMSAGERAERKERRKSMPLQSSSNDTVKEMKNRKNVPMGENNRPNGTLSESKKALTGSTPNLLAEDDSPHSTANFSNGQNEEVLRYERDKMLSVRDRVQTKLTGILIANEEEKNDQASSFKQGETVEKTKTFVDNAAYPPENELSKEAM